MPSRNLVYEALVLRARETPAGDRVVSFMCAEAGIVEAFVFGGPKSKLRSLASPYAAGRAFVYLDPVRDFRKLADFEAREAFSGLRDSLKKLWAAGLVAELLMKTSGGGGDYPEVLELALEALRGLETLPEEAADYPLLLFLWRLIELLGLMPDPSSCVHCGADLDPGAPRVYSARESGYLCPRCGSAFQSGASFGPGLRDGRDGWEPALERITAGAARWLERASLLSFREALRASLDAQSLAGLKALAFGLARRAAEAPLASLSAGAGIL